MRLGRRWERRRLVVLATAVMAVATLMQYSMSAISPALIAELHLSPPQYGSLFTVYFIVCSLGSLAVGDLTQRMGATWGMALVGIAAAAGLLIVAVSTGVVLIYVGLVLSGIASAFANPATNLALINVEDRGPAIGIKQSGVQISAVASGVIVVPLASAFGWRTAFAVCATMAILLVPATLIERSTSEVTQEVPARGEASTSVLGLALFAFLMGLGLASTIAYLPVYATHQAGMSAATAGQLIGIFGICAVIGRIGWGYLSERSARFARPEASLGTLSLGALIAAGLLLAVTAGPAALLYVGAALMGLTGAAWNGLVMTLVVATSEPQRAGKTSGHVQAAFFAGLCLSPLIFGLVVGSTGSYVLAWGSTAVVYLLALVVSRTKVTLPAHDITNASLPGV